jgi:glycosyltransferase involved in cell wall biosynthesis
LPDKFDIIAVTPRAGRGLYYEEAETSRIAMMQFTHERKYKIATKNIWGANIAQNRTNGIKTATEKYDTKWVFFVDDDMVVPPDCIIRMIEADKDIVSGFCVLRKKPFTPCAWMHDPDNPKFYKSISEWPDDSLIKVDAVGGACMLVKTEVFRHIKRPWFHFYSDRDMDMGEDIFFCRKAKRKGYDIWLDTGLIIGHVGDCAYTIYDYLGYREQQESLKRKITNGFDTGKLIKPSPLITLNR